MVETFLRENGVRYEGLLFRFGICPDKLLAAYPQLERYRVESPSGVLYSNASPTGVFRKVPLGWELPTADQPLIREIASKVPRVYNTRVCGNFSGRGRLDGNPALSLQAAVAVGRGGDPVPHQPDRA